MYISGDSYKSLEWIETNIRKDIEHLELQSMISSKQTVLSYIISFAFSSMAIVFSVILSTAPDLWWVAIVISALVILGYFIIYKFYDSEGMKSTSSEKSCRETARDFQICVVDKLMLSDWYMQEYIKLSSEEVKLHYYFEVFDYVNKAISILERMFAYEYDRKIVGLINKEEDRISLYRLEEVLANLRKTVQFMSDEYKGFVSTNPLISREAKQEIGNALFLDSKGFEDSMISRYNSIIKSIHSRELTSYITRIAKCDVLEKPVDWQIR